MVNLLSLLFIKKLSYRLVYPGRYFNTFPALSDHFKFINDSATELYVQMAQRDRVQYVKEKMILKKFSKNELKLIVNLLAKPRAV